MKIELLWYNPVEKEYQVGDKESYRSLVSNSNEAQNFVIFEKFCDMSYKVRTKLKSKIERLNSYRRSTRFA